MLPGDPDWIGALGATFASLLRDGGDRAHGLTFSLSEEYVDPPREVAPIDGGPLGWTLRITDGRIEEFVREPASDVDVSVRLDYAVFDQLARIVVDGDEAVHATMTALIMSGMEAGTITVTRHDVPTPTWLTDAVHDTMARLPLAATAGPVAS